MQLKPNAQQLQAADLFLNWWDRQRFKRDFHLRGLAGTGKTWILQYLERQIKAKIAYCAPTGKAARVVAHRVKKPATTIHKLMYRPLSQEADEIRERLGELRTGRVENPDGGWLTEDEIGKETDLLMDRLWEIKRSGNHVQFSFKAPDPDFAQLLIADEGSMIGSKMGEDFKRVEIPKVIVCDPFQLSPVKDTWAYENVEPDIFLTKIMRTGDGSGVAMAAMDVREGRRLQSYGSDFVIHKRGVITLADYESYDMILVGRNDIRKSINKKFRGYKGYDQLLVEGEKVMSLTNQENGISNGELLTVERIVADVGNLYIANLVDPYGNIFYNVEMWKGTLRHDEGQMDCPRMVGQFCYGYAITVHKSQGSEGDRVLLLNSWGEERHDYRRWLYTGITRAAKECHFVQ